MTPGKILKKTEVPGKVLYTVELEGKTYVAVVVGGYLGGVLDESNFRKCRANKVINAIKTIVGGK